LDKQDFPASEAGRLVDYIQPAAQMVGYQK